MDKLGSLEAVSVLGIECPAHGQMDTSKDHQRSEG